MAIVKAQIAAKSREGRLLQLTSKELAGLPPDTQVYEGVGKMYAKAPPGLSVRGLLGMRFKLTRGRRFVLAPTGEVLARLDKEAQDLKADQSNLDKKLHYLETTYNNSKAQLDHFLNASGPS
jgi:prefoldin subunit 1